MATRYAALAAHELDDDLISAWDDLQAGHPEFASPYLSPWFTKAVAEVRDDTFVAVLYDGHRPAGFFPFQRSGRHAKPVAGRLNDCQAVIVEQDLEWSPKDLMRACGLTIWDFDHLIADQVELLPFARIWDESPIIDLSTGYDAYQAARKTTGGKKFKGLLNRQRKLMREFSGAVRLDMNTIDPDVRAKIISWKLDQCRRTGTYPYFEERWAVDLLERLHRQDKPGCSGVMSVLRVGDEIVAAHFGMTSRDVLHWWFPGYARGWSSFSPGNLLLLLACEQIGSDNHPQTIIDLGKGDDDYKAIFSNGSYPLIEGHVSRGSAYAAARTVGRTARAWARRSPLLGPVRTLRRKLRGT